MAKPDNHAKRYPPHIKRQAVDLMAEHLTDPSPEGKVRYKGDVKDPEIAARCGMAVWSVQTLRKALFGELEQDYRNNKVPSNQLFPRVAALEEAIQEIRQEMKNLNDALTAFLRGRVS